jgi:DNA ligase-1
MNKVFPPLYKLSSTGALQIWQIAVEGSTIVTVHGQLGGAQQTATDTVLEGKNAGKKNATTPETQALADAQSKWEKKKKGRYVEDMEAARAGEVDTELVQGGIPPMLSINKSHPADPILDQYLEYPCMEQPKLDGVCCLGDANGDFNAVVKDGKASLWSRTQKRIRTMPHVEAELERLFHGSGLILFHGELYNHDYRNTFQDLVSIINGKEPDAEGLYKVVQLHVYDLPRCDSFGVKVDYKTPYIDRYTAYQNLLKHNNAPVSNIIVPVDGFICFTKEALLARYEQRILDEYEGSMAKNLKAPYGSGKRSHDELKMKEFIYGEAEIVEVLDGRGKDANTASKFRCKFWPPLEDGTPDKSKPFVMVEPTMKCSYKEKARLWARRAELPGKLLTIKYKRLTDEGVPYIVSGQGVRDYE